MKLYFESIEELKEGLGYLQEELDFTFADQADADYIISVFQTEKAQLDVSLDGKIATILYGGGKARFYRAFAFLMDAIKQKKESFHLKQEPSFETNGPMLDVTSAPIAVSTLEFMIRRMALMGLNMLMLYTEDNYEIEGRPYFGHFRGRYTKEELRHLDAYAQIFGIELIPCIQVLGHLAGLLQWDITAPFKDTDRVLLAESEETYRLIEDMFQTVKECFTTKRVHIGMDETFDLGLGNYLKRNNPYRKMEDLYLEHLKKMSELAEKYGLEPMIWSDMFFRFDQEHLEGYRTFDPRVTLSDKIINTIPKNMGQICWIYDTVGNGFEKEFYTHAMSELKRTGNPVWFAGATRNWSGFTLQYGPTLNNARTGLTAAMDVGVKEVIATVWGGREHSLLLCLPGLALYAAIDYLGKYDEASVKETFRVACREDFDLFMKLEALDRPNLPDNEYGVSRQVTYNDPLLSLLDLDLAHYDTGAYYKKILPELQALPKVAPVYQPLFDVVVAHCDMLSNKADFGIRAKAAYDAKDTAALTALKDECSVIIEKLQTLRKMHRDLWFTYYKPFGWEAFDIKYGGLIARFDTTQARLDAYLKGEIDSIEELAEDRLSFSGASESKAMTVSCRYSPYSRLMSLYTI